MKYGAKGLSQGEKLKTVTVHISTFPPAKVHDRTVRNRSKPETSPPPSITEETVREIGERKKKGKRRKNSG